MWQRGGIEKCDVSISDADVAIIPLKLELELNWNCVTSFHLLGRPPRNFEAFVGDHFRQAAFSILAAYSEYASGRVGVGYYSCNLRFPMVQVWRSFIERMVVLYPRLLEAFRRNGASLEGLGEQLEVDSQESQKKSNRVFKKIVTKIKQMQKFQIEEIW